MTDDEAYEAIARLDEIIARHRAAQLAMLRQFAGPVNELHRLAQSFIPGMPKVRLRVP